MHLQVPAKEVESPSDDIASILTDKISALDINNEEKKEKKKEAGTRTVMQVKLQKYKRFK